MKFIDYSPLALRTAKPLPHDQQVQHALLGLITEVGELADCIKKHVVYGKELDKVNLMEEIGDLAFYLNLYMHTLGVSTHIVDDSLTFQGWERPAGWDLVKCVLLLQALIGELPEKERARHLAVTSIVEAVRDPISAILRSAGFTLSDALTRNIDKLALRYGDKYSDYNALNRDTAVERTALEGLSGG